MAAWTPRNLFCWEMESLAQLEVLCERLYNSQDSAERAHAENTLKCFSLNSSYISQCQYILDNASTPYALMLASSSLLKQVTEQHLSLQLRLDIRNVLISLQWLNFEVLVYKVFPFFFFFLLLCAFDILCVVLGFSLQSLSNWMNYKGSRAIYALLPINVRWNKLFFVI